MNEIELLKFHIESGVHDAVDDVPRSWFDESMKKKQQKVSSANPPIAKQTMAKASETAVKNSAANNAIKNAINNARAIADKVTSFAELVSEIKKFEGCELKKFATNTVVYDGVIDSEVMLIGEAPGANEDEQGIPFCGVSGQLLDKMLDAIGLSRKSNILISNTIYWRPPGNRQPTQEEVDMCRPFVEKMIALVKPKHLIFCGGTAAISMLNSNVGITKMRGIVYPYQNIYLDSPINSYALFHPSYLMRQPAQKKQAWHDLQFIESKMR